MTRVKDFEYLYVPNVLIESSLKYLKLVGKIVAYNEKVMDMNNNPITERESEFKLPVYSVGKLQKED